MKSSDLLLALASGMACWMLTSCCCPCEDGCGCDPSSCDDIDLDPEYSPVPQGPRVDLGVHSHPLSFTPSKPTLHDWTAHRLRPPAYRVGYGLAPNEAAAIHQAFQDYARSVNYRDLGGERFQWSPRFGCGHDMACVFEELASRNWPAVKPIARRFRSHASQSGMNSLQAAEMVISFVQDIRYDNPKREPFGLLPPALVMSESRGDCDSKALLALMILEDLNVSSLLISSEAHRHTMLGVALPASGRSFEHRGRRYAFVECTAKGAPIGHMDPSLLRPNDWRAVPVHASTP
jgi:hypothetical protein